MHSRSFGSPLLIVSFLIVFVNLVLFLILLFLLSVTEEIYEARKSCGKNRRLPCTTCRGSQAYKKRTELGNCKISPRSCQGAQSRRNSPILNKEGTTVGIGLGYAFSLLSNPFSGPYLEVLNDACTKMYSHNWGKRLFVII